MFISKEIKLDFYATHYGIKGIKQLMHDSHVSIHGLNYAAKYLINMERNGANHYKLVAINFDHDEVIIYIHYVTGVDQPDIDNDLEHLFNYFADIALPDNDYFIGTIKQCYDDGDISEKVNNLIYTDGKIKMSERSEQH